MILVPSGEAETSFRSFSFDAGGVLITVTPDPSGATVMIAGGGSASVTCSRRKRIRPPSGGSQDGVFADKGRSRVREFVPSAFTTVITPRPATAVRYTIREPSGDQSAWSIESTHGVTGTRSWPSASATT